MKLDKLFNKKNKSKKIDVVEEDVIRKEQIKDAESLAYSFRLLVKWAQESKKKGWGKQERFPVAIFVVNVDPKDYHRMKLQPEKEKHQVKMSMLAFVNAMTPGELMGGGDRCSKCGLPDERGVMHDVVRAYVRNAYKQMQNNE